MARETMVALVRFFSFAPRAAAPRWLAWFVLTLGILWLGAQALAIVEGAALVAVYAVFGLALAKLATETVRRVHDCGQSARLGLKVVLGIVALLLTACLHWIGYGGDAVFWVALALAGIATAALLLRPGTPGANAYGAQPTRFAASVAAGGKAGIVSAAVFLIASIAFGLAVLDWQAAMERQREARMERAG